LYLWWKKVYPNRPDPLEAAGWNTIYEKPDPANFVVGDHDDDSEADRQESREALAKCAEIERAYEKDDEEMLIRLIKIRGHLWT
jgi:hypothetical protein